MDTNEMMDRACKFKVGDIVILTASPARGCGHTVIQRSLVQGPNSGPTPMYLIRGGYAMEEHGLANMHEIELELKK